MTGTHLSQQVYALLTYIQATQSQTLLEKSTITKSKSKEKKKAPKGLNMPGKVSKNIFSTGLWVCFSRISLNRLTLIRYIIPLVMFCPVPIVQVASFNHVLTVNSRNEAR